MTVVLLDPRRPSLIPVEAVALLSGDVVYTEELPIVVPWSLSAARSVISGADAAVLLSSDRSHPEVVARLAAGEVLIAAPDGPPGERLIDAVAMMDRLRTDGAWEGAQTHDSLCRFLLEETYELFDAVRSGDADALCAELGDVLLQVLFHARIAQDAPDHPFDIDDVAESLLHKLGNRAAPVLAGEVISAAEQLTHWEAGKAAEKAATRSGGSILEDLPTAQPALALASKVLRRLERAGLPAELIPPALTAITVSADCDAESELRAVVLQFMDTVRVAEKAIIGPPTEAQWRAHWPTPMPGP